MPDRKPFVERLSDYLWVRRCRVKDAWAILRHGNYHRTDTWYD